MSSAPSRGRMRYVVDLGHVLCGPFDSFTEATRHAAEHGTARVRPLVADYLCDELTEGR